MWQCDTVFSSVSRYVCVRSPLTVASVLSRASHANCDHCGESVDSNSIASWCHLPSNFDICEMCFMNRSSRDPWEVPFIDNIRTSDGSLSEAMYIHLQVRVCVVWERPISCPSPRRGDHIVRVSGVVQVEPGRLVFSDNTELTFDVIPPPLCNDRVTFIQTACSEGKSTAVNALQFDTRLPVKLYLGFRSDQAVPAWVNDDFALTPHIVMVKSSHFHRAYVVYESKVLYIPGTAAARGGTTVFLCKRHERVGVHMCDR